MMVVFVIEKDPVVLLDMVGGLRDLLPNARIEHSTTLSEAREKLLKVSELAATFVGESVRGFESSDLPEIVSQKNSKVIVAHYGNTPNLQGAVLRGWSTLSIPFTNETIAETLTNSGV